jgi:protein kinase
MICLQSDELFKICGVMGSPAAETWPDGIALASSLGFEFVKAQPKVISFEN